ncbi:DNA-binding Lrp family transcriptional regulator [Microbacterium natoriense]|uniref:DNA-binding Lrp family transcriptional regulator n=1 Tax=Microbacterium natoriense TaxID=284570 RepID=A0AAW8ESZ1_9MICO|nr:Lrp/AsnC family transcriptional regulator [Microbacterium natoriense]MDQ0646039.1 DNA-binding Lrp family transcriptional regulator [Microbacterium natoriense]
MHARPCIRGNLEESVTARDFDADLVRSLQRDGRTSIRSLAAELGLTRAAAAARLRALVDSGAVRVVAAVDPALLGQHVLAHVSIRTDREAAGIAERLRAMDETVFVSTVGGSHDLVIEVWTGSMPELHDLLGQIRTLVGVADIDTLIYTAVTKGFFVSDYHGDVSLDAIDEALVDRLQIDGRTTFRVLGEEVRLSPSAVATRVQRLIGGGVIKISAVEARGLSHRQLSMGIGLSLTDDDEQVLASLHASRGVDFVARTLGRFDAVATLVEPSAGALYASLENLRALPGVAHVESWLHLAVLKEDYARRLGSRAASA